MYSKARVAGHAMHPMLVAFPIAFYTATVATLLAYIGTQEAFWYRVAMVANIAGVATAVIAAIPGTIDLLALPRGSRARAIGRRHAGYNLLATGLFAVTAVVVVRTWTHRAMVGGEYAFDATIPLALSVVAWVAMATAGSLGFRLVQVHHIGVKPALTLAERPPRDPEPDTGDTGEGEIVPPTPRPAVALRLITTNDRHDRDDHRDRDDHHDYRGRPPTRTTATS